MLDVGPFSKILFPINSIKQKTEKHNAKVINNTAPELQKLFK